MDLKVVNRNFLRNRSEHGMVTAETAVVLPSLVLVAGILVGMLWLGSAQATINESARFLARSLSQGDSQSQSKKRLGARGEDLTIRVKEKAGTISVRVTQRVSIPTVPRVGLTLIGTSTAVKE